MKRRIFLKKGGLSVSGLAVVPALLVANNGKNTTALPPVITDSPDSSAIDAFKAASDEFTSAADGIIKNNSDRAEAGLLVGASAKLFKASERISRAKIFDPLKIKDLTPAAQQVMQSTSSLEQSESFDYWHAGRYLNDIENGAEILLEGAELITENSKFVKPGNSKSVKPGQNIISENDSIPIQNNPTRTDSIKNTKLVENGTHEMYLGAEDIMIGSQNFVAVEYINQ